jgi:hypothetical protein
LTPLGAERQAAGARQVAKVHKATAKALVGTDLEALERALIAIK